MIPKTSYFFVCSFSILIYSFQQLELPLAAWVNNYVNDFLCLPIVLGLISQLARWMKKDANFHFSFGFTISLATFYAIYFEYYLPNHHPRYTGDWIDVLLYFLGSSCYFLISQRGGMLWSASCPRIDPTNRFRRRLSLKRSEIPLSQETFR